MAGIKDKPTPQQEATPRQATADGSSQGGGDDLEDDRQEGHNHIVITIRDYIGHNYIMTWRITGRKKMPKKYVTHTQMMSGLKM